MFDYVLGWCRGDLEVADNTIYSKVVNSLIKNKGDKTEAEHLFAEYLNAKYVGKVLSEKTKAEVRMEVDRLNDYIQHNYSTESPCSITLCVSIG